VYSLQPLNVSHGLPQFPWTFIIYMNGLMNLNVDDKLLCSAGDSYSIERKKY